MRKLTLILAMSSIVAYGQQNNGTLQLVKPNTDDTVRIVEKCNYIFNQDSTQLTYVCGSDSMAYEAKVKEVKPSPFKKMFLEALEAFIIVVVAVILILFLLACGL